MKNDFKKFLKDYGIGRVETEEQYKELLEKLDNLKPAVDSERLLGVLLGSVTREFRHRELIQVAKAYIEKGKAPEVAVCLGIKEVNNLTLSDFQPEFSSRGHASAVLSEKRGLSGAAMLGLATRFEIPIKYFFGEFD